MTLTALDPEAEALKARGLAPQPPPEERAARLGRARAEIAALGLDGLLVYGSSGANPEPVRYLAGYVHVYPSAASMLVIPASGDPVLLIDQPWHVAEARKMCWVEDIRVFPHASRGWMFAELRGALRSALESTGLTRGRLGVFEKDTPELYAAALREGAPELRLEEGKPVWEALVASPSQHDMEMIQKTADIADEGQAAAARACAPGRTEQEVCIEALGAMATMGAEFLHGSGLSTHVNIGSYSDCVSNVRPFLFTARPLGPGQMFWLDLSASYAGYYVDCCRTISIGDPGARQREIYDVSVAMYRAMQSAVRPGVSGGEVWEAGFAVAEAAGYGDYVNHVYFGHTTGIATSVRPVIARGETAVVREGSLLNIEPGIFVPGVGSAGVENALYVTEHGAEAINNHPISLQVAGRP